MKAILFFTAFAVASNTEETQAELLRKETGSRVVFRNGAIPAGTGEKPEACLGIAGAAPSIYDNVTPRYEFEETEDGFELIVGAAEPAPEELNALGLPVGCPDDRKGIKAALDEAEVPYHKGAPVKTLVEVFKEHFTAVTETEAEQN